MIVYLDIQRGFSFWPLIVMPKRLKGGVREQAYLEHEQTHYKRQRWWTPIWIILYFLSKSFRWQEEKLAFKAEIEHLINAGIPINRYLYVEDISEDYWGMCTVQQAAEFVRSIGKE